MTRYWLVRAVAEPLSDVIVQFEQWPANDVRDTASGMMRQYRSWRLSRDG